MGAGRRRLSALRRFPVLDEVRRLAPVRRVRLCGRGRDGTSGLHTIRHRWSHCKCAVMPLPTCRRRLRLARRRPPRLPTQSKRCAAAPPPWPSPHPFPPRAPGPASAPCAGPVRRPPVLPLLPRHRGGPPRRPRPRPTRRRQPTPSQTSKEKGRPVACVGRTPLVCPLPGVGGPNRKRARPPLAPPARPVARRDAPRTAP